MRALLKPKTEPSAFQLASEPADVCVERSSYLYLVFIWTWISCKSFQLPLQLCPVRQEGLHFIERRFRTEIVEVATLQDKPMN